MPRGIYPRTESQRQISRDNAKKRRGKQSNGAKYKVGYTKGDFTIIERITPYGEKVKGGVKFICQCNKCGETREISNIQLCTNRNIKCSLAPKENNHNWVGQGEMSGSYWGRVLIGAKKRNIDVAISKEEAWDLYLEQDRKCAYTGKELAFSKGSAGNTASLDRKDSKKGYTLDNIHWIHKDVNIMKRDFPEDYFLSLCKDITEYTRR